MVKARFFWDWFIQNKERLSEIDNLSEISRGKLLDTILVQLQSVNSGFYFELAGGNGNSDNEFIVTVGGDSTLFGEVDKFISYSPSLKGWKFISLKPASGVDFVTEADEFQLDPRKLWFLPLNNPDLPNKIGIKIGVPGSINYHKNDKLFSIISTLIETVIGERMFSLDIYHLSIGALPIYPDKDGYMELKDLSEYIIWKKEKNRNI